MAIKQDILWMPQPEIPANSPDARPKGLLDQLLEDGSICKKFVMDGTTFQVKTTARFDPRQACFFRSAVSREDDELTDAPWGPIFCNLTEEVPAGKDGPEVRLKLARRALETHLSLCHRVERQLEEKGDLTPPRVLQTRVSWSYLAAILSLVAFAGAKYGLERWRLRLPGPPVSARSAEFLLPVPSLADILPETRVAEDSSDPGVAAPGSDSEPNRVATIDRKSEFVAPSRRPPKSRQEPEPARQRPRAAKPQPTEPEPILPPPPAQITAHPPTPAAPTHADMAVAMPTLITEIVPSDHQLLRLEPGVKVYRDASIRISEIPRAYRRLPCVTTVSRQGGTEQGILLQLNRPARVFVAHDLRVKKKPEWLASFRATGETLRALEVDKGREIGFAIFRRDAPAGAVALGSNTRAKVLKRKIREFVPRKSLAMYLVCLADANGQVPSP